MSRFKDFGSPENSEGLESFKFKLYNEEFQCKPKMQGKTLLKFASASSSDDSGESSKAITDFFDAVLLPESKERFNALLEDEYKIVSVETLGEILGWIVEAYSARPTQES
jgi:hypothetical protein